MRVCGHHLMKAIVESEQLCGLNSESMSSCLPLQISHVKSVPFEPSSNAVESRVHICVCMGALHPGCSSVDTSTTAPHPFELHRKSRLNWSAPWLTACRRLLRGDPQTSAPHDDMPQGAASAPPTTCQETGRACRVHGARRSGERGGPDRGHG